MSRHNKRKELALMPQEARNQIQNLTKQNRQLAALMTTYHNMDEKLAALENLLIFIGAVAFYQGKMLEDALSGIAGQLTGALTEFIIATRRAEIDLVAHDPDGLIPLVNQCLKGIEQAPSDGGEMLRTIFGNNPGKFRKLEATWKQISRGGRPEDEGLRWLAQQCKLLKDQFTWNGLAQHFYTALTENPPAPGTKQAAALHWLESQPPKKRGANLRKRYSELVLD